ncbi:MAG TPA: aminoacyl-histidine dipeptidase [Candidatus Coprenecus stercoravium]|uniref:Cytosol non-specific dipeptidase n=1 Tax=Candidatus Coprenecus stercoravium TaxID=2840735 RepID=A0A9D2KBM0_9BACT|nr:aminoacyl-histidine dipeptidase [Candidatus Coprenecus stercoravium]
MTSEQVLAHFRQILTIPRESGHEEHIIAWLQKFAADRNMDCKTDEAGNVLITIPATPGREDSPTIILQSHSDMVCEKNSGVEHDFSKDPIKAVVENGWLIAKDTTLGADCGIGIAAELAVLEDKNLPHGKIECLFTTSEETGLDGAFALKSDFLTGSILLNLDSEDEGELFIGCAGGIDTTAKFKYSPVPVPDGAVCVKAGFCGGIGGHSGDDIDKGRSNAVQSLARFLYRAYKKFGFTLCSIDGGNKRNAIAREAYAVIAARPEDITAIKELHLEILTELKDEYSVTDPDIAPIWEEGMAVPENAVDDRTAFNFIRALHSVPHGVMAMSAEVKGLVETSSNLASVKMLEGNIIRIGTSQRSSTNSARRNAADRIEAAFSVAGAEVTHESEYPGWKPSLKSHILEVCKSSYRRLFGKDPVVRAIHAGLECGLFLDKYPHLDMISFGPTLRGVHAPGERLDLASLDKFVLLLEDVIKQCK